MCKMHTSNSRLFDGIGVIVNVLISANRFFIHQTDTIILWIAISISIFLVSHGFFHLLSSFWGFKRSLNRFIKREKSFPQYYRNVLTMKIIVRRINIKNEKDRNKQFKREKLKRGKKSRNFARKCKSYKYVQCSVLKLNVNCTMYKVLNKIVRGTNNDEWEIILYYILLK